jgi:hypothetical protein
MVLSIEEKKKYQSDYYLKNRNKQLEDARIYREENREILRKKYRKYDIIKKQKRQEKKIIIFNQYGNKCVKCQESNLDFLTIDHINEDGNIHRKKVNSCMLYDWIIDNNFPNTVQLLCYNCNSGGYLISNNKKVKKIKIDIINGYGGSCSCCNIQEPHFLTIDHINNDGYKEKKSGCDSYWKLKREGYPKKNIRLLCWNCNCSRRYTRNNKCPHEIARENNA